MQTDQLSPEALFQLLGNEKRMAILEVLWEALDVEAYLLDDLEPVSFSDLRQGAAVDDVGNFNYHLGQLEGLLVDAVDDGYVLSPLGYNVLQAIEGHATFSYWTVDPTELDDPCPFCNGTLEAEYAREVVFVRCLDCEGHGGGSINRVRVPANSHDEPTIRTLLDLSVVKLLSSFTASRLGLCPACHAPAEISLLAESDDDTEELRGAVRCRVRCSSCGSGGFGPLYEYALAAPSVQTFFEANGTGPSTDLWGYRLEVLRRVSERLESTDPVVAEYAFTCDDDEHTVVISGTDVGLDIRELPTD